MKTKLVLIQHVMIIRKVNNLLYINFFFILWKLFKLVGFEMFNIISINSHVASWITTVFNPCLSETNNIKCMLKIYQQCGQTIMISRKTPYVKMNCGRRECRFSPSKFLQMIEPSSNIAPKNKKTVIQKHLSWLSTQIIDNESKPNQTVER